MDEVGRLERGAGGKGRVSSTSLRESHQTQEIAQLDNNLFVLYNQNLFY